MSMIMCTAKEDQDNAVLATNILFSGVGTVYSTSVSIIATQRSIYSNRTVNHY